MTEFEVAMPLAGGILIGIAAAMTLLFSGKIAGISGIFGGILFQQGTERTWQTVFVAGLIAGGVLLYSINTEYFEDSSGRGLVAVSIAGLLVGIGTRVGGGCTSGHGVCVASAGFRHVHLRLRLRLWWQEWPWWPFFKIFITEN